MEDGRAMDNEPRGEETHVSNKVRKLLGSMFFSIRYPITIVKDNSDITLNKFD